MTEPTVTVTIVLRSGALPSVTMPERVVNRIEVDRTQGLSEGEYEFGESRLWISLPDITAILVESSTRRTKGR
jgi:hypothetical protein